VYKKERLIYYRKTLMTRFIGFSADTVETRFGMVRVRREPFFIRQDLRMLPESSHVIPVAVTTTHGLWETRSNCLPRKRYFLR
jgi:hypothetical protein